MEGWVSTDILWFLGQLPPGAVALIGVIALMAALTLFDVFFAWWRTQRLRQAEWRNPQSNAVVLEWHRAVSAMVGAGTAPSEADEEDYFYHLVGYRFDRARAIASSLMVVGLLGTFIGMAMALYQSSAAMVSLQDEFGEDNSDETAASGPESEAGDSDEWADNQAAEGRVAGSGTTNSEHSELEVLRDELKTEMGSATNALGAYVGGQRKAVSGMAIGVSTSIAGISAALFLFMTIGLARRSWGALLEQARRQRYEWLPQLKHGTSGLTAAVATLPVAVAAEVKAALTGVGALLGDATAKAIEPLSTVVDKFGTELEAQTKVLTDWSAQQESLTTAAGAAYHALGQASARSEALARENAQHFSRLVAALEGNAEEVKQFRDGFEDYINNLDALGENYRRAGEEFEQVVRALGSIQATHGALNSAIQQLDGTVVGVSAGLSAHTESVNQATHAAVQHIAAAGAQTAQATQQSAGHMIQSVEVAIQHVARTAAQVSAQVVQQLGPDIAVEIARGVNALVVRKPWYKRLLPFIGR